MPTIKFKAHHDEPYDKTPVQFKVRAGVRDKLKAVPNWQERLREYVDLLIEDAANSLNNPGDFEVKD